jgi:hypothetical protein
MSAPAAYPAAPAAQQAAPTNTLGILSLVLGIVSIFAGWTFLAPIAGLVLGIMALTREPHNRTMAIWGIVLNAVLLAGSVLLALLAVIAGIAFLPFIPFTAL